MEFAHMSDIRTETVRIYCEKYADEIFFRAKINSKWGAYPYSQLPEKDKKEWVSFWSEKEGLPHRTVK